MFGEGVSDQVILVPLVETYSAVGTYQLLAGFAVDFQLLLGMLLTSHHGLLLDWRKTSCLRLNITDTHNFVGSEIFPELV